MKHLLFYCFVFFTTMVQAQVLNQSITKIAFGSCGNQDKDQSILYKVADKHPDVFIYLGDNIYGDSKNMEVLRAKYDKLASKPEFQNLRNNMRILATWDDHDYGSNDAGKKYPMKEESKALFLEFWQEDLTSERFKHEGIYHVEYFGEGSERVQVILFDTRTFRTRLKYTLAKPIKYKNDYRPNNSQRATMLGKQQWLWLEEVLKEPAALRIMASSNQFGHEYNGYESWTNFPKEQQRMLDLISSTRAEGVIFISGDVHWGELSKFDVPGLYPIYDVTSSGLTQTWGHTENNSNRVGEVVPENNFGLIEIDWQRKELFLRIYDKEDKLRVEQGLLFEDLQF